MSPRKLCLLIAPSVRRAGLAMAALLLALTAAAFSWLSWQREVDEQLHHQEALVEVGAHALDAHFSGYERALGVVGQQILERSARAPVHESAPAILAEFNRRYPELQIILLIRPDGSVIAASDPGLPGPYPSKALDTSFQESLARLHKGENMVIGRPFLGKVARAWITPMRYAVRDPQGKLLYILGAGIPLANTLSFWKDAPVPAGATMSLLRDDGYLVARYPVPDKLSQEQVYSRPVIGALARHLQANHYPRAGVVHGDGSVTGDGQGSTLVFRRLTRYPLTFYYRSPHANLVDSWWEDVWFTYLLMALLAFGGAAIHIWSGARQERWGEQRTRHIDALEAANQELASFTYTISHDLRGPLRAIDGFAALHREELARVPGADTTLIDRIRDNSTRMEKLIDGLLDFSRHAQVELNLRPVNMAALAQSALAAEIPPQSPIAVRVGELPASHGDPALLRKVWDHLIANAVKYSRDSESPLIEVGYSDGAYFVRDNGVGFDMAHAPKLFGVFSRLHAATQFDGTGVSLAIVRRIVERHGGRIWARAEVGGGAEFRFTLAEDLALAA